MNKKIIEFYLLDLICISKQFQTVELEPQTIDAVLSGEIKKLETQALIKSNLKNIKNPVVVTELIESGYNEYKNRVRNILKHSFNSVIYDEIEFSLEDVSSLYSLYMYKSLAGQVLYNADQIKDSFINALDELIRKGTIERLKELRTINKAEVSKELVTNFINNFFNHSSSNTFSNDDIKTLLIAVHK